MDRLFEPEFCAVGQHEIGDHRRPGCGGSPDAGALPQGSIVFIPATAALLFAAHPLATVERPTLEQLAAHPLVSYHPSFTGRTRIDAAFAHAHLKPDIVLEAIDSDVIKTYVRLGLGVGIVAEMAVRDDGSNADLAVRPLGQLFGQNVARVAFKRSAYLRNFVFTFAELLSDRLDRKLIARAMDGHTENYDY